MFIRLFVYCIINYFFVLQQSLGLQKLHFGNLSLNTLYSIAIIDDPIRPSKNPHNPPVIIPKILESVPMYNDDSRFIIGVPYPNFDRTPNIIIPILQVIPIDNPKGSMFNLFPI